MQLTCIHANLLSYQNLLAVHPGHKVLYVHTHKYIHTFLHTSEYVSAYRHDSLELERQEKMEKEHAEIERVRQLAWEEKVANDCMYVCMYICVYISLF